MREYKLVSMHFNLSLSVSVSKLAKWIALFVRLCSVLIAVRLHSFHICTIREWFCSPIVYFTIYFQHESYQLFSDHSSSCVQKRVQKPIDWEKTMIDFCFPHVCNLKPMCFLVWPVCAVFDFKILISCGKTASIEWIYRIDAKSN